MSASRVFDMHFQDINLVDQDLRLVSPFRRFLREVCVEKLHQMRCLGIRKCGLSAEKMGQALHCCESRWLATPKRWLSTGQ